MRTKLVLLALAVLLSAALVLTWRAARHKEATIRVLKANEKSYRDSTRVFRDSYGREIALRYGLQRTADELKRSMDRKDVELRQLLKAVELKPSSVVTTTVVEQRVDTVVRTVMKDSCFRFDVNPEFRVTVCVRGSEATLTPHLTNTLSTVIAHRRETVNPPRRFFLWRLFQKRHTVVVVAAKNSNPAFKTGDLTSTYVIER